MPNYNTSERPLGCQICRGGWPRVGTKQKKASTGARSRWSAAARAGSTLLLERHEGDPGLGETPCLHLAAGRGSECSKFYADGVARPAAASPQVADGRGVLDVEAGARASSSRRVMSWCCREQAAARPSRRGARARSGDPVRRRDARRRRGRSACRPGGRAGTSGRGGSVAKRRADSAVQRSRRLRARARSFSRYRSMPWSW